jgi:hypothetical protein
MMHGLGDTAAGWLPVGQELKGQLPHVKWILPTAPTVCACLSSCCAQNAAKAKEAIRAESYQQGAPILCSSIGYLSNRAYQQSSNIVTEVKG